MVGGYMVREVGTTPEITLYNTRPYLEGAVLLASAICEANGLADLEIVNLQTGKLADENEVLAILGAMENGS